MPYGAADKMPSSCRSTGAASIAVEQNIAATLRTVEPAIVLKTGRLIFDGTAVERQVHEDLYSWF